MVKLPPPVWALLYLIAAGALSWMYPWRRLIEPPHCLAERCPDRYWFCHRLLGNFAVSARGHGTQSNFGNEQVADHPRTVSLHAKSNVLGAYRSHDRGCIRSGVAADVRSSRAPVHDAELGAYPIRRGENAPTMMMFYEG